MIYVLEDYGSIEQLQAALFMHAGNFMLPLSNNPPRLVRRGETQVEVFCPVEPHYIKELIIKHQLGRIVKEIDSNSWDSNGDLW